jgi:hypothetical protein
MISQFPRLYRDRLFALLHACCWRSSMSRRASSIMSGRSRYREVATDTLGSSELSVTTLLTLAGVACVGICLPSLIDSAQTMGDVFRSQVSVLSADAAPGGNVTAPQQSFRFSAGPNGVAVSGAQGSFHIGPRGVSGSVRETPNTRTAEPASGREP